MAALRASRNQEIGTDWLFGRSPDLGWVALYLPSRVNLVAPLQFLSMTEKSQPWKSTSRARAVPPPLLRGCYSPARSLVMIRVRKLTASIYRSVIDGAWRLKRGQSQEQFATSQDVVGTRSMGSLGKPVVACVRRLRASSMTGLVGTISGRARR